MSRYLFLDDVHLDRTDGVERRGHPARRYPGNPLFTRQFPWERSRLQLYGRCVLYNAESRLYQLYYLSQPGTSHHPNIRVGGQVKVGFATLPSYAQSPDGIHWERPLRPDVPFEDIPLTNLLDVTLGQSFEPGLLWDPDDPDPSRRYKAFVWDQRFSLPRPGKVQYRRAAPSLAFPRGLILSQQIVDEAGAVVWEEPYDDQGILVAFNADGIRWRKHPDWVLRCYSDTGHSVLCDPDRRQYVAYGRFNQQRDSPAFYVGRNVARVQSADFLHWSHPELVLAGDDQDPDSLQINGMPVDRYEGIYIGLMELDVRPHPDPGRPLQLATSRDGRHWTRVADRQPFIEEASPGAWDGADGPQPPGSSRSSIRPAAGLFAVGDEIRMYHSNTSGPDPLSGVGLATWRRDGFVSLHAGPAGGRVLTRAFVPAGPELHLNVDASAGEATVRVGDFQGRPLSGWRVDQPSEPIRGDHLDAPVRWPDSDFGQRVGKATTLRITLRDADLYSFWTG
ncbi:MAG: hypothetical protein AB1505_05740 [Candidatus Latescibacterota bacterium]